MFAKKGRAPRSWVMKCVVRKSVLSSSSSVFRFLVGAEETSLNHHGRVSVRV